MNNKIYLIFGEKMLLRIDKFATLNSELKTGKIRNETKNDWIIISLNKHNCLKNTAKCQQPLGQLGELYEDKMF